MLAKLDERAIKVKNFPVPGFLHQAPSNLRSFESFRRLRIHKIARESKLFKLLPTSFAYRPRKTRIAMTGEVQERICLGKLLAHEQQWQGGSAQKQRYRDLVLLHRNQVGQTRALAGVGHLIVILDECHKAIARQILRRTPKVPSPE